MVTGMPRCNCLVWTVAVLLGLTFSGRCAVSFKQGQAYPVGTSPQAVVIADFNMDSKVDLAVMNFGDPSVNDNGSVSILLGNGDGTFQPATNVIAGTNPTAIAAADFNADGRADLV